MLKAISPSARSHKKRSSQIEPSILWERTFEKILIADGLSRIPAKRYPVTFGTLKWETNLPIIRQSINRAPR